MAFTGDSHFATVYLSRRNLLTLIAKLDRKMEGKGDLGHGAAILKRDTVHPKFPCSHIVQVIALEDAEYYTDREPGFSKDAPPAAIPDRRQLSLFGGDEV